MGGGGGGGGGGRERERGGGGGVDPGLEKGGAQNCWALKFFFPGATLTFKSTTRFGHLGIVTLSSQLASTSMRWLKITILRLFVATAININAFLMQEQGPLTL